MWRVGGEVVVPGMAFDTGVGGAVVVAVVAGSTIVCDSCMGAVQFIKITVVVEDGGHPIWIGAVATCAIGREI